MAPVLIRQFEVFANPSRRSAEAFPFLVVLQADWITNASSVVVAPLVDAARLRGEGKIYPVFPIAGRRLALAVTDLASMPRTALRGDPVANLRDRRDQIIAALDLLFTGI